MKEITLVRHAKSSWEYEVNDKDRPLQERGINDAYMVANYLKGNFKAPDVVFSSPAIRALHTCIIVTGQLGIAPSKIHIEKRLYDFEGTSVINFIKQLGESYKKVMIFGHNHAFTSISNIFGNKSINNVPTAGVVQLRFDVGEWKLVDKGTTELIIFPKQLK
ncbi:histidine phosphatase family protein [Galbibacter sp. PAP.153]|uniref:SixA phosphatase family protein n=1 Tax=Galbibacter sp. PAP.153 TaxID=3104623 RepID=UPI0030087A57